jgi:tRNA (guanine37-N1)-methyltransferase
MAKAIQENQIAFKIYNLRDYSTFKHRQVDDESYGGGPGMVLRIEPLVNCLKAIHTTLNNDQTEVAVLTPSGEKLTQSLANRYADKIEKGNLKHLVLFCGRYEGFDERFLNHYVDRRIRIGDCVFMGGEIGALLIGEAVSRLLPGVIGNAESLEKESFDMFSKNPKSEHIPTFDYPVYTRPAEYEGLKVPSILLSGKHLEIESWRLEQAQKRSKEFNA